MTLRLSPNAHVTTAAQSRSVTVTNPLRPNDIATTPTQSPAAARKSLFLHDGIVTTLHPPHRREGLVEVNGNRITVTRTATAGGTLVQNICTERHTVLPDEPAHWMSWRSLLLLTNREEAEGK